ncbi:phosphoribosylanthranilate isomerase [Halostella pelagica]|uniref:phosphoribosylanthranilate isomerase n=1 Tax=Halostella pelagica TaxID=2583824 RepID=UPI001080BF97|nr:phosphoribosylanthranilate isomerase [Halostella pelagica]
MTRAKICGITRETDLRAAVDAGADAIGVICDVPVDTPREVSPDRAAELVAAVPPFVTSVLVTMVEDRESAAELVGRVGPDAVQEHGDLSAEAVAALGDAVDADVIKSVDAAEPERAAEYDGVADALLVDSVSEDGGGGTGETHDWERTRDATADLETPLVLAGGLTPENVAAAVRTVDPYAVDVASGVERANAPGRKDHDAVSGFVDSATGRSEPARRGSEA